MFRKIGDTGKVKRENQLLEKKSMCLSGGIKASDISKQHYPPTIVGESPIPRFHRASEKEKASRVVLK